MFPLPSHSSVYNTLELLPEKLKTSNLFLFEDQVTSNSKKRYEPTRQWTTGEGVVGGDLACSFQ